MQTLFYLLIIISAVYFGARLFYKLIISNLTADSFLEILKNFNIIPGKSKAALQAEQKNPFQHRIFLYVLVLLIPIVVVLSFIRS